MPPVSHYTNIFSSTTNTRHDRLNKSFSTATTPSFCPKVSLSKHAPLSPTKSYKHRIIKNTTPDKNSCRNSSGRISGACSSRSRRNTTSFFPQTYSTHTARASSAKSSKRSNSARSRVLAPSTSCAVSMKRKLTAWQSCRRARCRESKRRL